MTYQPLYVKGLKTGLVQNRQEFILPDDAYPVLENAFIFREQLRRRQGLALLGRFQRNLTSQSLGLTTGSPMTLNIYTTLSILGEPNAQIKVGSVTVIVGGAITFTDQGNGQLTSITPGNLGLLNYATGDLTLHQTGGVGATIFITFSYFPGLPAMGLRSRELNSINVQQTIGFDTKYAYKFIGAWQEFIPGTTWTGTDSNFFWSTNYWVGDGNQKIFWVTNFSGVAGDPIRYTNGTNWADFAPQIDAAGNLLNQSLALIPYRGRLLALNTLEGLNLATSVAFFQRIRWAAIGTPFTTASAVVTTGLNPNAWRDDIRGQGGFLDIPTSEAITSCGFVRDNLVIFCERSTWQLRYTGRAIAPFQIEKVNSELGSESTFSSIQFDTSLVGVGDKGIVECDSFKSDRIDIKIPDLVFEFRNLNAGTFRVHGVRDFQQKLAYWTYVFDPGDPIPAIYPNRRLVYNYENDSWAIFTDSLTCLGTFQSPAARTWASSTFPWEDANFPWFGVPANFPDIVGGNQQGYVLFLSSNLEPLVTNEQSLFIQNITGNTTTPTVITSPNHNLATGQVIQIVDIPTGTPFATSLNHMIFGIVFVDANNFQLWIYDPATGQFTIPQLDTPDTYIGGGQIKVRDGFRIQSKKFNFLEKGENIQIGFVDALLNNTDLGSLTMNVYLDYNDSTPINIEPENNDPQTSRPDPFFNSTVLTSNTGGIVGTKNIQRVYCSTRGNFITIEWTLSNAQLISAAQESDVQIDMQIIWMRPAGRYLNYSPS